MYMAYTTNPNLPRVRGEAILLVRSGKSTREVARRLGWSQSAVSQWVRKAGPGWYGPLPTHSSRPKTSPSALSKEVVSAIIAKRVGRRRCGQVIHHELREEGIVVSLPSVQRTLERLHLLKKRSPWKRPHDFTPRPEASHPGALLEADTVHLMLPDGSRLYAYTLIDLYSRWAYAEVVERISATQSARFITHARKAAPFCFSLVQSDHGSEFSTWFTHALWEMGLAHRHSRVRQSNDQAHIERFNRTVQEECLDHTAHTITALRAALRMYMPYYNTERSHMGINFKKPIQMLQVSTSS